MLPRSARALLSPGHHSRQADYLSVLLADKTLTTNRRQVLDAELQRLHDADALEARNDATRRRIRNELRRALVHYRLESLRRVLQQSVENLDFSSEPRLSIGLLVGVLSVAEDPEIDSGLFRRFIAAARHGQRTVGWPENAAWLKLAKTLFRIDPWLAGFDETREIAGTAIRYKTEFDLVRAAHMGTWFDTCLALDRGFNRASALTNAVEINRLVLYGVDPGGNVVARKLIAITTDWKLVGYRTYAHHDQSLHKAALEDICADLAQRCGLEMTNNGHPMALTEAFWYDDGTEEWNSHGKTPADLDSFTDAPDVSIGQSASMNRHLLSDERIRPYLLEHSSDWRQGFKELVAGLWLDNRIPDPSGFLHDLVADDVVNDRDGDATFYATFFMGVIDPDRFSAIWKTFADNREELSLRTPPTRTAAMIAARFDPWLSCGMLHLLTGQESAAHIANFVRGQRPPTDFEFRLLLARGAPPRKLLSADRRAPADEWYAAWSTPMLRRGLRVPRTAEGSAIELALRLDNASLWNIKAATARSPESPNMAVAAAVLGDQSMSSELFDASTDIRVQRVFVHLHPTADVSFDEETFKDIRNAEASGVDIAHATAAAGTGNWAALNGFAMEHPTLVDHPLTQQLFIDVLTEGSQSECTKLAGFLATLNWSKIPRDWYWREDLYALTKIGFTLYAADGPARSEFDEAIISACIRQPFTWDLAPYISRRLSTSRLIDFIVIERQRYQDSSVSHVSTDLGWVLAERLLRDPDQLRLEPAQLAFALDEVFRRLNAVDAERIAADSLSNLSTTELQELVDTVLQPGSLISWLSWMQRRVLLEHLSRFPPATTAAVLQSASSSLYEYASRLIEGDPDFFDKKAHLGWICTELDRHRIRSAFTR